MVCLERKRNHSVYWAMVSKTIVQLSVDEWGCPPSVSCLACGNPEDYRLCGRVNGDRQESTPRTAAASSSAPVLSHTQPRPPQETLQHEQAALAQSSRSLLVSLRPGAQKILFMPSESGVSFSPVLWKSCNQILLAFKVRFPEDS